MMIKRINEIPNKSFLLFGPRGTGKSTWLNQALPNALKIDLLNSTHYLSLSQNPNLLDTMTAGLPSGSWIIIDEIQRIPELLNEVHRLYENRKLNFALSGSSARQLRRKSANLLAGRALQLYMFPFVHREYSDHWSVLHACQWGSLPLVVSDPSNQEQTLASYVETYIKEEITAEALVRNLDPFIRVLRTAGLYHGQILNLENLARESQVKRTTVERYFQILEDTLIASKIPALHLGIRAKEVKHAKFFLFDNGIARIAAGLKNEVDSVWTGFAFEGLIFHELRTYNSVFQKDRALFHYAVSGSFDVDFLIETKPKTLSAPQKLIAIEVKSSTKFKSDWLFGLKTLLAECPKKMERAIVIYQGSDRLVVDGIDVVPVQDFLQDLYDGKIF